jgi:hypothetical protein
MPYDSEGNYIPDSSVEIFPFPNIPTSALPSVSTSADSDVYAGMSPSDIDQYNQEQAAIQQITNEQAPAIQAVEKYLASAKDLLPQDQTTQIQNLSESLLQQQTQIQDFVNNAVQQQQAINSASQQYQSAAQSINDSTSAYNSDYNAWLNAQSGVKRNNQPYTIGQMMAVAKQYGKSPADAWGASWTVATRNTQGLIDKYNQDLNNINSAKQKLADSQNAYNNSVATYRDTTQQLQNLVNNYNNNYTEYQSVVGTAKSDLATKAEADKAAAVKAEADRAAAGGGAGTTGTTPSAPAAKDPETQLRSLLSIGTPDALAKYTSLFGSGATGNNQIDFYNLIAWDDINKKYVINEVALNSVIASNPAQADQIKNLVSNSIDSVNSQIAADPTKAPVTGSSTAPTSGTPGGGGGGGGGGADVGGTIGTDGTTGTAKDVSYGGGGTGTGTGEGGLIGTGKETGTGTGTGSGTGTGTGSGQGSGTGSGIGSGTGSGTGAGGGGGGGDTTTTKPTTGKPKTAKPTSPVTEIGTSSVFAPTDALSSVLLGSGLSYRPDMSTTSQPYFQGTDEPRQNVWNTESLKNALGI